MVAKVLSRDGTEIAYDKWGSGPPLIIVLGALNKRGSGKKLAQALSDRFTAVSYDRRGRGDSGDTPPYSVRREIDDIEALIDALGGRANLYGHSSGAVLSLLAAQGFGRKSSVWLSMRFRTIQTPRPRRDPKPTGRTSDDSWLRTDAKTPSLSSSSPSA